MLNSKLKFYQLCENEPKFILQNSSSIEDHTALFEEISFIKTSILEHRFNYILDDVDFSILVV